MDMEELPAGKKESKQFSKFAAKVAKAEERQRRKDENLIARSADSLMSLFGTDEFHPEQLGTVVLFHLREAERHQKLIETPEKKQTPSSCEIETLHSQTATYHLQRAQVERYKFLRGKAEDTVHFGPQATLDAGKVKMCGMVSSVGDDDVQEGVGSLPEEHKQDGGP